MNTLILPFHGEDDENCLRCWKSSVLVHIVTTFIFRIKFEFVASVSAGGGSRGVGDLFLLEEGYQEG